MCSTNPSSGEIHGAARQARSRGWEIGEPRVDGRGAEGGRVRSRGGREEQRQVGGDIGRRKRKPTTTPTDDTLRYAWRFSGTSRKVKVAMPPRSCKNSSNRYPTPIQLTTPFENIRCPLPRRRWIQPFFPFIEFLNAEMPHCCCRVFIQQSISVIWIASMAVHSKISTT